MGVHLNFTDLAVYLYCIPKVVKVRVKASKTDPYCSRMDTFLHKHLCPLAANLSRALYRGPLHMLADGKPLTRLWFVPRSREEFSQAAVNYARLFFFELERQKQRLDRKLRKTTIQMLERCNSTAHQICIKLLHDQLPTTTQGAVKLTSKYKTLRLCSEDNQYR